MEHEREYRDCIRTRHSYYVGYSLLSFFRKMFHCYLFVTESAKTDLIVHDSIQMQNFMNTLSNFTVKNRFEWSAFDGQAQWRALWEV